MELKATNTPWGTNKHLSISLGICVRCKNQALHHIHTRAGLAEYNISGLCEDCYDEMAMKYVVVSQ